MSDSPAGDLETAPDRGIETVSKKNAGIVEQALNRALTNLDRILEENPKLREGMAQILFDLAPIAGGVSKIGMARREFSEYDPYNHSPEAEQAREIARERCVVGLLELALDTATLGTSIVLPDELLTWINRANMAIRMKDQGEDLGGCFEWGLKKIDIVGRLARGILKSKHTRSVVDQILGKANSRLENWEHQDLPY